MRRSTQRNVRRIAAAKILFAVLFLAIGGRAIQLQLWEGDKLMRLGQRQHLKEWIVLPKRGAVFDRTGEPLALSMESQSVYARPHRIQDPTRLARSLAPILNLPLAETKQKITSEKPFVWMKRQVSSAEAEKIQALNVDGIGMFYEPHRQYPQGQLAGQLLGFVGRDSEGLEGLELKYNDYIRGETGSSMAERDALGRRVLVQGVEGLHIPPGSDIHLTLDTSIQYMAEKELEASVMKYRAKAGVATALVDYPIGTLIAERVQAMGVKPFYKHFAHNGVTGPNMATVYSDRGQGVRAPVVFYNRGNEAAAQLKPGDVNWQEVFAGECELCGVKLLSTVKSFRLLSVSVSPPTLRIAPVSAVSAGTAVPSGQLPVP